MRLSRKLRLLLASARIANLPSVAGNVWLGVVLGVYAGDPDRPAPCWMAVLQLVLSGMLLYLCGNFLNDWHDRHWDAQHRPERALPQHAFAPAAYLGSGVFCALTGLGLAFLTNLDAGLVASLIVLSIIVYTRWHKRAAWPVVLLGLCRALLPLLYFVTVRTAHDLPPSTLSNIESVLAATAFVAPHALALLLYVTALSLAARRESTTPSTANAQPFFNGVLLVPAGLCMAAWSMRISPVAASFALLPFALWLARCLTRHAAPPQKLVGALLAGIPLLDWVAILPMSLALAGREPPLAFMLTSLLLPPLAFVGGRRLQRLAAAT